MHARRVVPDEERLVGLLGVVAVEEVDDLGRDFLVHGLRAIERQRALVLAALVLLACRRTDLHQSTGRGGVRQVVVFGSTAPGTSGRPGIGVFLHGGAMPCTVGDLVDVGEAHLLHRVEVIEIAPVFLEAVRGRQRRGVVAEMVLAELAGVVAEVEQEFRERRRAGPQIGRAAGQLRRDHAGAQRIHAGEEGVAARGAALHGDIVHEDRAFVADAVDVGRFAHHQAAVVDARLHPADVVAHDEEDVGLGLLRGSPARSLPPTATSNGQQAEPDRPGHAHVRLTLPLLPGGAGSFALLAAAAEFTAIAECRSHVSIVIAMRNGAVEPSRSKTNPQRFL